MIQLHTFAFNPFGLNTYLVYDKHREGFIVDAGNSTNEEDRQLFDFVASHGIRIKALLMTHLHIDHIVGVQALCSHFNIKPVYHPAGDFLLGTAALHAQSFGFRWLGFPAEVQLLDKEQQWKIGDINIESFYTPGHVDGSLCYYLADEGLLFAGDVLFKESIGRTDLETGNYNLLMASIKNKLLPLPDETVVLPGHGPASSIGHEKKHNPFLV